MELTNYIERNLARYVQQCLHDGYSENAIRHALLSKGHDLDIVDKSILFLQSKGYKQVIRHHKPNKYDLDEELFAYMVNLIYKYVKHQEAQGFKLTDIKEALLHYGHSYDAVEHAIDVALGKKNLPVSNKKTKTHTNIPVVTNTTAKSTRSKNTAPQFLEKFTFFTSLVLTIAFMILFSMFSNTSIALIFISFLPVILTLFTLEILHATKKDIGFYAIAIPIVASVGFRMIMPYIPLLSNIEVDRIMVVNIMMSMAITAIYLFARRPSK